MGVFDSSIGPFLIGTVLACLLTGITASQSFQYYQNFPNDRRLYKWLVFGLFLLDMSHTAVSINTLWDWFVENYGNVAHLAVSPWSFAIDPAMVGVVAFTCQAFYAYRVYIVGKRKWLLPLFIGLLSTVSLAFAIASTVQIFHLEQFARFKEFTYGVAIWLGVSAAADILITASLVFYLRGSKTGLNGTNSILNRIIELTIGTNGLTCTVAILDVVLFAALPDSTAHAAPNLCLPKLYFNSLLVSLNARIALERRLIQSHSGNGGESHGLAELSIAGQPFQPRGGKSKSQNYARPNQGGGFNGIQVTTHRSIIADQALNSSTYLPSETVSTKELPFFSSEKEDEEARRNYNAGILPFDSDDRSTRSPGGSV
ncbi:hypothetical protein JCM3765_004684 [Sporobolomyces pararoseus]